MADEVRDERPRPWAWFDHEIIDLYATVIGPMGIAVYMALLRFCGNSQTCYPSSETLEEKLGLSHQSIWRATQKLIEAKLISVERRLSGPKGRASNIYTIHRPSCPPSAKNDEFVPHRNKPKLPKDKNKIEVSSPQEHTEAILTEVSSPQEHTATGKFPTGTYLDNVTESLTNHVTNPQEIAEVSSPQEQTVCSPQEQEVDTKRRSTKDSKDSKTENLKKQDSQSSSSVPEDDDELVTVKSLFEGWNTICGGEGLMPKKRSLNPALIKQVKLRIKEHPQKSFWEVVFNYCLRTPHYRGDNDRNWAVEFDWLMKNDGNALRLYERGMNELDKRQ